jgi:serine O-acetyltransferase
MAPYIAQAAFAGVIESENMLTLVGFDRSALLNYVTSQLNNFFPDGAKDIQTLLALDIDEALARLKHCINAVRMWRPGEFDYLHSSQYTIFLYFLSNTIWRNRQDKQLCTKLFYLNKALNGIDCFYEIELPEIFFIGHSVGIVLAKASYANYLVLYQNSTVGKNHGVAPVLEEGVILYPNTAVIGRSLVRKNSVISQGTSIINQETPGDCLVFAGEKGKLQVRANEKNILADIFRL